MAKVQTTFEKAVRNAKGEFQNQVLVISATANSRDEARDLNYEDFAFDLYINGKFIADISHVLAKTGAFESMVDNEDWERNYAEAKADEAEHRANIIIHDSIPY